MAIRYLFSYLFNKARDVFLFWHLLSEEKIQVTFKPEVDKKHNVVHYLGKHVPRDGNHNHRKPVVLEKVIGQELAEAEHWMRHDVNGVENELESGVDDAFPFLRHPEQPED